MCRQLSKITIALTWLLCLWLTPVVQADEVDDIEAMARRITDRSQTNAKRANAFKMALQPAAVSIWAAAYHANPERTNTALELFLGWWLPGLEQYMLHPRVPANAGARNLVFLFRDLNAWSELGRAFLLAGRTASDTSKPDPLYSFFDGVIFPGGAAFLQALFNNNIGHAALSRLAESWVVVRIAPANNLTIAHQSAAWNLLHNLLISMERVPDGLDDFTRAQVDLQLRTLYDLGFKYDRQRPDTAMQDRDEQRPSDRQKTLLNQLLFYSASEDSRERRVGHAAESAIFNSWVIYEWISQTINDSWSIELFFRLYGYCQMRGSSAADQPARANLWRAFNDPTFMGRMVGGEADFTGRWVTPLFTHLATLFENAQLGKLDVFEGAAPDALTVRNRVEDVRISLETQLEAAMVERLQALAELDADLLRRLDAPPEKLRWVDGYLACLAREALVMAYLDPHLLFVNEVRDILTYRFSPRYYRTIATFTLANLSESERELEKFRRLAAEISDPAPEIAKDPLSSRFTHANPSVRDIGTYNRDYRAAVRGFLSNHSVRR